MANLTLVIDDDVLRRARMRALERGTSVNAVVRELIEDYAGEDDAERRNRALAEILDWAQQTSAGSGAEGRTWTRGEIYEARVGHYGR